MEFLSLTPERDILIGPVLFPSLHLRFHAVRHWGAFRLAPGPASQVGWGLGTYPLVQYMTTWVTRAVYGAACLGKRLWHCSLTEAEVKGLDSAAPP